MARKKTKLCTKLKVPDFTGFKIIMWKCQIFQGSHDLDHKIILHLSLVERNNLMMCIKFEVPAFPGFEAIVVDMPNFLGVT